MSDVKIKEFADSVGISVDRLLVQLTEAGVGVKEAADSISEEEKSQLLSHLRKMHGADANSPGDATPNRVTLNRRESSKLKQPGVRARRVGGGGAPSSASDVSVVVKKKRTYVKRTAVEEPTIPDSAQVEGKSPSIAEVGDATTIVESTGTVDVKEPNVSERPEVADVSAASEDTSVPDNKADTSSLELAGEVEADAAASELVNQDTLAEVVEAQPEAASVLVENTSPRSEETPPPKGAKPSTTTDLGKKKEKKKGKLADRRDTRNTKNKKVGRKQAIRLSRETNIHAFEKPVEAVVKEIDVGETVVVSELASRMAVKSAELVKVLMNMGVMVTLNQVIDRDVATLAVEEMGHTVKNVADATPENLLENFNQGGELLARPPIVTVMGHVDHGKTSLLDRLRSTDVVEGEAGGITQHIGAYHLHRDEGNITFLDTPGHAAFSAMRARGAKVTDMVVLVVAADDGVKPQTVEAINHARAAEVPIVVAVNKIDKPGADTDRVKQELVAHEVIPEEWGGDTMFVNVSAKTGEGLDNLLEVLLLQAEVLELSAVQTGPAAGFIIESKLDRGRGAVASIIVTEGTLSKGDIIVAGAEFGRARSLIDENGKNVSSVGPSMPIQIVGLSGVPDVGDEFHVVSDERKAREIAEFRANRNREQNLAQQQKVQQDNIFAQIAEGELKSVNVLIKADVHGSAEALATALSELSGDEISVKIVSKGVGGITESDVNLALASNAIVIGFNVRAEATARRLFQEKGLEVRYHSIIYEALDEIKAVMSGMLEPEVRQQIIGLAEVKDVFRSSIIGDIAGCMVTEGSVKKSAPIRVLRDNVVIYEGELESLRRFKDEVSEVKSGVECGIGVKNYNNIRVGDQIEVFERITVSRAL